MAILPVLGISPNIWYAFYMMYETRFYGVERKRLSLKFPASLLLTSPYLSKKYYSKCVILYPQ